MISGVANKIYQKAFSKIDAKKVVSRVRNFQKSNSMQISPKIEIFKTLGNSSKPKGLLMKYWDYVAELRIKNKDALLVKIHDQVAHSLSVAKDFLRK